MQRLHAQLDARSLGMGQHRFDPVPNLAAAGVQRLANDIAKRIQESMEYPGQIKITTIRETRAVEYAR